MPKAKKTPKNQKKATYVLLPNGCYRTEIKVTPKNWHTQKASMKVDWCIWYRFYDPSLPPPKTPIKIRGMNKYHDLAQRQQSTRDFLETETELVDVKGFNPRTKRFSSTASISTLNEAISSQERSNDKHVTLRPITPQTGLVNAIDWAYENIIRAPGTIDLLKSAITYFWWAAEDIGLSEKPIGEVEMGDIRLILDQIGVIKGDKWTAHNYNFYIGHLGMLFSFLREYSVFKINPIAGIAKRKKTKYIPSIMSDQDYKEVDEKLKESDYYFWRFVTIFGQSNCRRPELLGVQYSEVDKANRSYKVLILKDSVFKWETKYIEDYVWYLWEEVLEEAEALKDTNPKSILPLFLFSAGLVPRFRIKPIRPEQVTRRWKRLVKDKLGAKEDFYNLKHRKTTKDIDEFVDAILNEAERRAADKNSHTTTTMVKEVYDVKNKDRRPELVRLIKHALKQAETTIKE